MMESSLVFWGLFLIVGFPLSMIGLIEVYNYFIKISPALGKSINLIRIVLLPMVALSIALEHLFGISHFHISLQLINTFLGLLIGYISMHIISNVLISGKPQHEWQIRVPSLLFQVIRVAILLTLMAYVLASIWRVDLTRVFAALGVGSLVVALALQDTLSNLVSGFLLLVEQPFQVGDWLRVGDKEGEVLEMNWRAVRLKTRDRDVIIIPNGVLGGATICNYTMFDPLHAERVFVRFSYGDPPNQVKQILRNVAMNTDGILKDPLPDVRTVEYGDFFINYQIKFYILDFTKVSRLKNRLLTNIYYAAKRHHLTIPFPTQIESKIDTINHFPEPSIANILDLLRHISYFNFLSPDNLEKLAQNLTYRFYGAEEVILYADESNPEIYVIYSGEVKLSVEDEHGKEQVVMILKTGDIFGEMSLFSKQANNLATVRTIKDLQVLVIDAEIISDFLYQNPRFAISINDFVTDRQKTIYLARGKSLNDEASGVGFIGS